MRPAPDASLALLVALALALPAVGCGGGDATDPGTTFFVTSDKSPTGDLGGLAMADARCRSLAADVGLGDKTWHAYLSVDADPAAGREATDARDRIGQGPWTNAAGAELAADLASLHAREGDFRVFLDEHGQEIPGFWPDSPSPPEHDVLTGSNPDGTAKTGATCEGWTSASASALGFVGHTDGLDDKGVRREPTISWNSSHGFGCDDTRPAGGAGRLYCFGAE